MIGRIVALQHDDLTRELQLCDGHINAKLPHDDRFDTRRRRLFVGTVNCGILRRHHAPHQPHAATPCGERQPQHAFEPCQTPCHQVRVAVAVRALARFRPVVIVLDIDVEGPR